MKKKQQNKKSKISNKLLWVGAVALGFATYTFVKSGKSNIEQQSANTGDSPKTKLFI